MASVLSRTKTSSLAPLKPRAVSNPASLNGLLAASWSRGSINQLTKDRDDLGSLHLPSQREKSGSERRLSAGLCAPFIKRQYDWAGDISCRVQAKDIQQLDASSLIFADSVTNTCLLPPVGLRASSSSTAGAQQQDQEDAESACLVSSRSDSEYLFRGPQLKAKAGPLPRRLPSKKLKMLAYQPELVIAQSPILTMSLTPQISFSSSLRAPAADAALEPRRRSPPPESRPVLCVACTGKEAYVLSVHLPGYTPEMVTVSARKDDKLAVVADLWHAESDCHHEWLVTFPARDVYVSLARAQFSTDGTLTIRVPRREISFF